jgi:hypothetical protein
MGEEDQAFAAVVAILEELGIPYAITGSLASAFFGEPRATIDADIVARLTQRSLAELLARLPPDEFYHSASAAREALATRTQFNVIHIPTAYKIDFFVAGVSNRAVDGAESGEVLPGLIAQVSPPEDVILSKLDYYRMAESPKHLRDIAGMLQVSGDRIDRDRIRAEAGARGTLHIWEAIIERVDNA